VYVASGTFRGLTGDGSVHGPGTFLHLDAGTVTRGWAHSGGAGVPHPPRVMWQPRDRPRLDVGSGCTSAKGGI
jgi:hypothetical protein